MMMKFSIFTVGLIFLSTFPELKGRKIHFLIRIDQIPNLDTLLPIDKWRVDDTHDEASASQKCGTVLMAQKVNNTPAIQRKMPLNYIRFQSNIVGRYEKIHLIYGVEMMESVQIETLRCEPQANLEIFIAENEDAEIVFWKEIYLNKEYLYIWSLKNYFSYDNAGIEFIKYIESNQSLNVLRGTIKFITFCMTFIRSFFSPEIEDSNQYYVRHEFAWTDNQGMTLYCQGSSKLNNLNTVISNQISYSITDMGKQLVLQHGFDNLLVKTLYPFSTFDASSSSASSSRS